MENLKVDDLAEFDKVLEQGTMDDFIFMKMDNDGSKNINLWAFNNLYDLNVKPIEINGEPVYRNKNDYSLIVSNLNFLILRDSSRHQDYLIDKNGKPFYRLNELQDSYLFGIFILVKLGNNQATFVDNLESGLSSKELFTLAQKNNGYEE